MSDENGGVIEDGVILIEDNRIRAVGPRGSVDVPAGAQQVDVTGKTIIPGLLDAHAHGPYGQDHLLPQPHWQPLVHLSFGVTTATEPTNTASQVFAAAETHAARLILMPGPFLSG